MSDPTTLVIADDHPIFRQGLLEVLRRDSSFTVLGDASDGKAALAMIRARQPAIALLDMDMPEMTGLEVAAALRGDASPPAIVLLTMHDEADLLRRALDLGVMGYVLKDSAVSDIGTCLTMVRQGRPFVSPALTRHLLTTSSSRDPFDGLTPAELGVLRLVAQSRTTKEIAAQLEISPKTVEHHRSKICQKLGLTGTNALVRYAIEHRARLKV